MKINAKNQLGLAFDKYLQDDLMNLHQRKYLDNKQDFFTSIQVLTDLEHLFSNTGNKNYFFRDTAIQLSKTIKLDKGKLENFSFLSNLPAKKSTYLMGRDKFYRWHRWSDTSDILCLIVYLEDADPEYGQDIKQLQEFLKLPDEELLKLIEQKRLNGEITTSDAQVMISSIKHNNFRDLATKGIKYHVFGINMQTGELMYPQNEKNEKFEQEMMDMMRLILFTELSDTETVYLPPGSSNGSKKQGKHLNDSSQPIIIVDSSWNKKIIRSDSFTVSGHLRWQPHGPNMQYRKLIYIDEFEKSGYIRQAKQQHIC